MLPRSVLLLPFLCLSLLGQSGPTFPTSFQAQLDGRDLKFRGDSSEVQSTDTETRFRLGKQLLVTLQHKVAGDGVRLQATLKNVGTIPVRLGRVTLSERSDKALNGAHFLAMSGWPGPSRVQKLTPGSTLTSKVVTEVFEPASGRFHHAGFVSFDRVSTLHELRSVANEPAVLRSICDFEGYSLPPSASVTTEELWVSEGLHLEDWASAIAERYKPRLPAQPPAGWVGWSWVDPFNIENYQDVALRNARAIRQRLPGLPIDTLWVSLGNLPDRRPGAWLSWNNKLFPAGREKFIADVQSLGYRMGLWSGAFWLNSALTEEVARLRPAFLLKDGKPLTVPHRDLGEMYILDPTHPLTLEHIRKTFSEYRNWGIRYYMIDFLNAIGGSTPGTFRPSGYAETNIIPGPAPYRKALQVMREAAGPDTFLLASTGPTLWTVGIFDGVRAGSDYGEGRPLDGPGKGFWPGTFIINNPTHWTSHQVATDAIASHSFLHRKLFWTDAGNVLTVGQPVPLQDAQISTTIFGLDGGQIMLGDEISQLPAERLRLLRLVFPRLPEIATAVDLFTSPEPDYPKIFHLPIKTSWDEWDLYAVFNYGSEPLTRTIPVANPSTGWDFWNEQYLPVANGDWKVTVAPGSVRLIRLSRQRAHPWIAGTNLHIRQGQAEITGCRWNESTKQLDLSYKVYPQTEGSVFIQAPPGWSVANPKGLAIARDGNGKGLIISVPVREEVGNISIAFHHTP